MASWRAARSRNLDDRSGRRVGLARQRIDAISRQGATEKNQRERISPSFGRAEREKKMGGKHHLAAVLALLAIGIQTATAADTVRGVSREIFSTSSRPP